MQVSKVAGSTAAGGQNPAVVFVNVPVEEDPMLRSDDERCAAAILQRRRDAMVLHATPQQYCPIDFRADVWDFRPMNPGRNGKRFVLRFETLPTPRLRRYAKFWLRYCYDVRGIKASSLYNFLRILSIVASRIVKAPGSFHFDLDLFTTDDIFGACVRENAMVPGEDTKAATRNLYLRVSYAFWSYCIDICGVPFPVSTEALKKWSDEYGKLADLEENRTPDIPEEYFQAIFAKCLEVVRAEAGVFRYNDVLVASVLLVLSQTGMRIGDALALKTGDLQDAVVEGIGEKTAILEFGSAKPTKGHSEPLRFRIFASPVCEEAFRRLLELRKGSDMASSDILVVPPRGVRSDPYGSVHFRGLMQTFFLRNLPLMCRRPWPGIERQKLANTYKNGERPDMWIPGTHQYRVRLCSYLYRKGVDIIIIEKQLAHLSESMYGYYIRMADNRDKLAGFGEKFIEDYVRRGYEVSEPQGAKVQEAVLAFLKEKDVNVNSSTEEILAALRGAVTVRQKGVGYCVRASFTPCSQEPEGSRLLCTYGMCPNYVTLFHAADATLCVFRGHMSACRLNLAAGHRNAAAKELCDARETAERHLLPQLRALEKEYNALGWDELLRRHPHLEEIVYNLSEIKKEVEEAVAMEIPRAAK